MADVSLHSVPLEDIIFDTFGGSPRFVPLSRASEELIRDLRDAIAPVANRCTAAQTRCPGWKILTWSWATGQVIRPSPIRSTSSIFMR